MKISKTTDSRHLGVNIEQEPSVGDVLALDDFQFEVQQKIALDNGNLLLSNPNYQLELEE